MPFRIATVAAFALLVGSIIALPATARPAHATATTVTVTAGKPSEFRFTLSAKSAARGVVTFKVTNKGKIAHDFKIAGKKSAQISPGKTLSVKITFAKAGRYPYECALPGHAAAGMKGVFVVK
jgi:uncharacterized cupredoxin-like copper-binding protein